MSRRIKQRLPTESSVTEIIGLSHDGRGIARINGKTTFITNALPGEKVSFKYIKLHSTYDEGYCMEVINPSENRVKPGCQHFDICGACNMQHMSEAAQLSYKQQVLLEQMTHFSGVTPLTVLPPVTADNVWGYRSKARLGVKYVDKKQQTLVGFRERINPRLLADMSVCKVLNPSIGDNIQALKDLISSLAAKKHIAQIELACGDEHQALIFRNLINLDESDCELLCAFGKKTGTYILLQPGGIDSIYQIFPQQPLQLSYKIPEYNLQIKFEPTDFTQINPIINRKLISHALNLLQPQPHETILDLFCGLGNFSLPMATTAKKVIGVEGSEVMVKRAQLNAQDNNITNAQFYCADLTQDLKQYSWFNQTYDKVLIDPPRAGALEIIQQIALINPKLIVYVSCNPATLARDSGVLVNQYHYQLSAVGVIDMFPHTAHVESIALFERLG